MIFDKLFGKKHEESHEMNDFNKIKKVIYAPKPEEDKIANPLPPLKPNQPSNPLQPPAQNLTNST